MPRRVGRPRKRRSYRGGSALSKIKKIAHKTNDFLKKTHLASTVLKNINNPHSQRLGSFAEKAGYGRKRKRRRSYRGGSFLSGFVNVAKGVNNALKKSKLVSKVLNSFPQTQQYGQIASSIGYGKKRKVRRHRMGGGMLLQNTLGIGYQPSRIIF